MSQTPPDYFDLASDFIAAHAQGVVDEDDGTVTVNGDTLADAIATRLEAMGGALRLALLFHAGGPWGDAAQAEWWRLSGSTEATTRVLCDHIRAALARAEAACESGVAEGG